MKSLYFKVADLYFSVSAEDTEYLKTLLPSYAPFNVPSAEEELILRAELIENAIDTEPLGEEVGQFDCGGTNHAVYRKDDGYKFVISNLDDNPSVTMITNSDFTHCTFSVYGTEADKRFGIGNAMMIAFAFSAAYHQTLLMHSSVTINGGKGYLFLGKSGTGKSTHSMLWHKYIEGSDLLNDDNPAVRIDENGNAIVYGTPWSGKTPCYRQMNLPIGAFVRLEQYPENIIRRETVLEAFASIFSSCSSMLWDKPSYGLILKTVEEVVKKVPVYYLKCRADQEAATLSHQTIAQSK